MYYPSVREWKNNRVVSFVSFDVFVVEVTQIMVFWVRTNCTVGRDSLVGTATRYGLDGPGIVSRWGARFSAPLQTGPVGSSTLLYNRYRVSFPGVKPPGRGFYHPTPSSAEVKESRAIPLPPLWAFMARSRANFTFYILHDNFLDASNQISASIGSECDLGGCFSVCLNQVQH
jgi:hypothetical protein